MAEDSWNRTHLKAMAVRPPWSPTDEDVTFTRRLADRALQRRPSPKVLVLGVTPRLVGLDWPDGTEIVAVDSSPGMIASTWEPHPALRSRVVCAPWQKLPFEARSFAAVVGDGSFNSLPALADYGPVFGEAARVLKNGALVVRCFIKPDDMEPPETVVAAARAGAFPTTAAFRFRFALALTGADGSVSLAHLHEAFVALAPDRDELAAQTGWPRADIDRVDVDKGSRVRFSFPTLAQVTALSAPHFVIAEMVRGTYTQAAQCPTIGFKAKT